MNTSHNPSSPGLPARRLSAFAGLLLLAGTAFALTPEQRNYDARRQIQAEGLVQQAAPLQLRALESLERNVADLAVTMDEVTGATRSLYNRAGYLTEPAAGPAEDIARTYLETHRTALGLLAADLEGMKVTNLVPSKATGAHRLYLSQVHLGLPVYGAQLHVNVNRDGRILSVNNGFLPNLARAVPSPHPSVTADEAVASALVFLGLDESSGRGLERTARATLVAESGRSEDPQLMWLPVHAGEARLVWSFVLGLGDEDHVLDLTVDAHSGQVMTSFDRVLNAVYRVYQQPVESPVHTFPQPPSDARSWVIHPEDATASPLGWHDTGTTSYTIMRGNNVHAYDDIDSDNLPPSSEPSCGSSLVCDFPLNLFADPAAYTSAAVTNLFYWANTLHDVHYHYGFDEASGNFQVNNFGLGGAGGDDVQAEAQDGGSNCNAYFSITPDGTRPRMYFYPCNNATPERDGDLDSGVVAHEYGHGISSRLVGGPSTVSCLSNDQQAGEGWSDYIGLWYTMRSGHQGTDARGIAAYFWGQNANGAGIRSQPYSTDPSVNTYTYESIDGASIPHGVGSVWAQALWEVTWALIDEHGFDADLFDVTAGAGNHRAMLYVTEGLKNTACSPTFVDARDGILQAAADNFGGEDVCLLWEAFAAFGLGEDAVSGGSNSTTPTNGYRIPSSCPYLEAGTMLQDHGSRTQAIAGFSEPRVVLGASSYFVNDPVTTRVENVTGGGFDHYLQEWDYLDGDHSFEVGSYLAVEDGASTLGSLDVQAGALSLDHDWKTVTFGAAFPSTPVVLAQVVSRNGGSAVTIRLNDVSSSGFDLRLQEEEGNDGTHVDETVHWVALEQGTTTVGSQTVLVGRTSNVVTDAWYPISFGQAIPNPIFLAANQTWRGVDSCTPRYRSLSNTGVQVQIDEEQSGDSETTHKNPEIVGYVVISQ